MKSMFIIPFSLIDWFIYRNRMIRMITILISLDDWLISRKRYWGLPLPIWECSCGEIEVIGSLEELKTSIQRIGLIHPVILIPKNGRFELIAGQRRFLAFQALGEKTIPSIIVNNLDPLSKKILSFTENIQRRDYLMEIQ